MEGLVNMMEEAVCNKIDKIWSTTDYCKCDKCRLDIATYALNRLPPRYINSLKGKVIQQFDAFNIQTDAEITTWVATAIKVVGEAPKHEQEKSI